MDELLHHEAPTEWDRNDPRPLRWLFFDLNSYFASVEQADKPELRGRPVAVVPVLADTTFCIAVSYEGKAFGAKTGDRVDQARRKCPEMVFVQARPTLYVHYHEEIKRACETVLPIDKVCSIDEMRFKLLGREQDPAEATNLAKQMKNALRSVSPNLTASVGIAPNPFLAKIATEMQKPDGLILLPRHELPHRLTCLQLRDFTGINRKMAARLGSHGIFTADDLISASAKELRAAFGSVIGERWWYLLRGYELEEEERPRKSLSHSHVLPPQMRTDQGAHDILLRLASKAMARLRSHRLWTSRLHIHVKGFDESWKAEEAMPATQSTTEVIARVEKLWAQRSFTKPQRVGIAFSDLKENLGFTPSLFEMDEHGSPDAAVDAINQKFGKNKVYLAALSNVLDRAGERIAFHKTELFSEGKGDNEFISTRHPETFDEQSEDRKRGRG
ncbi:MAG: hypothetical protein KF812_10760 [Fimbriimonadaceae bacterium]|nr:hypothetical protein [Fimbriimonadaceae bacterium]